MEEKPMSWKRILFSLTACLALLLSACGGAAPQATQPPPATQPPAATQPAASAGGEQVTITVWDYYTDPNATPIQPLIAPFEKEYPNIKVNYEIMDWDTALEKLNVALTGGNPPDVTTVDMTWLPKFAALGAFTDLTTYLKGGMLNGVPLEQSYAPGALEAMKFKNQIVTMMYDFDVYALYYRADLFEQKGIQVPTTWDELVQAAQKLAEGDKYLYEYDADTFHGSQFIYENGGKLMNADLTQVEFNSPESVQAIQFYADLLLKQKVAINWTTDEGERIQGVKDGRIAMFSDGPYYMGLIKSGAPEMSGMWKVAPHPYSKTASSYLGGTGLVIPANSKNQDAAWKFIEFAMRPENQIGVFKYAGAAPALTTALNSLEVNVADPYFGNQLAFSVFLDAMKTAHPFPYVRQWSDIDDAFTNAMQQIGLGTPVQQALDDAAKTSQDALKQ
jgi:ABC-type glycerol-3-phosphate transport system substrate-binding protein